MKTAVQLRHARRDDELPRCELLCGHPARLEDGALGPIALFGPGELVAYRLGRGRSDRLFLFRTLPTPDAGEAAVPGVSPRVRLLAALRSAGRVRLARRMFAHLTLSGREPGALSDAFYLRVGSLLAGRLPKHKILLALLASEGLPGPKSPLVPGRLPLSSSQ